VPLPIPFPRPQPDATRGQGVRLVRVASQHNTIETNLACTGLVAAVLTHPSRDSEAWGSAKHRKSHLADTSLLLGQQTYDNIYSYWPNAPQGGSRDPLVGMKRLVLKKISLLGFLRR